MSIKVTMDEADKKREYERILRQRQRMDTTTLHGSYEIDGKANQPNPEKRYRWINTRSKSRARAERLGFEKVDPKAADQVGADFGVVKDGAILLGEGSDLALYEEPVDLYEAKRQADNETLDRQIKGINEGAREKLNQIARDEGRVPAHKDVVEDLSFGGSTASVRLKK